MVIIHPNYWRYNLRDKPYYYFSNPTCTAHKKYEALRAFFFEEKTAEQVAKKFGYQLSTLYSLTRDFRDFLKKPSTEDMFFIDKKLGRREKDQTGDITLLIVNLRKKYLSVPEIKAITDSKGYKISEKYIHRILHKEGFVRLPRRANQEKILTKVNKVLKAPESVELSYEPERFSTLNSIGILCLLPYIKQYGIDKVIEKSKYPKTKSIGKLTSILSFIALKLSKVRRYSADDLWCMDRGLGLFAGLNVLPKTAWFSSYSSRITREMNLAFLRDLYGIWKKHGLVSDTINLDFTAIPYWGDDSHLENNWSGKRHTALASMLSVLAQCPDTGIITYSETGIRHEKQDDVVLEFLDFYRSQHETDNLKYLTFDSKLTIYKNLRKLDDANIKFVTIRRRGKVMVEYLEKLPKSEWKKVRVMSADGKGRELMVHDELVYIKDYGKTIRQIAITGHGKIKPALIITNDLESKLEDLIRKYSRRWIIEKGISEQIEFFHLNRVSSSMVIKVDFDLTMTVLAHNLYRLLALNLPGYTHNTAETLFEKFLCNSGEIEIESDSILIKMKKKRNLPAILSEMEKFNGLSIPWMNNKKLIFSGASST